MANTPIQRAVYKLLSKGNSLTPQMIDKLIQDHRPIADKTMKLYDRYKASRSGVPIFTRQMPNIHKVNNKVNNDFVGEIIDTKVGYLAGQPITYYLDKQNYMNNRDKLKEAEYIRHDKQIIDFNVRNSIQDLDAELVKLVSICGHAGREVYIDRDGNVRVANLFPWETIFLTNTHGEVEFALRYYKETTLDDKEVTKVEFFDRTSVTYYVQNEDDDFGLDADYQMNPMEHLFDYTPIVKVVNNEEELGDVDKVVELIDAYDRTMSDVNSEIEQFRLAYMYFKGQEPTDETIDKARQTGAYYVGEDGEVGFITKKIDDKVIENHLNRIEQNILRFAQHVNFTDEQFGANLSGVAMAFKLFALESKAMILETKMQSAFRNQYRILLSAWAKKGIAIDYLNLVFSFKRNLPVNILDEATSSEKLKGIVSERTRLSQLSFIDDVEYEIKEMQAEAEALREAEHAFNQREREAEAKVMDKQKDGSTGQSGKDNSGFESTVRPILSNTDKRKRDKNIPE